MCNVSGGSNLGPSTYKFKVCSKLNQIHSFGAMLNLFDTNILIGQVWLEKRYVGSRHTSEWFNTAGRNVKTGLIASVIVSQVVDSTVSYSTLLQTSN